MSQTVPPPDPNAPRPLPRRPAPRPPAGRANRPRFAPLDAAWAILLATLSLALSAHLNSFAGGRPAGAFAAAGTVAALYLLGWRARDRAAGVSAGLLAATSALFLSGCAYSPLSAAFTLLTIAALFAFVAGSSLAALALAAVATLVRPDGLLLGLLLMGLALAQQRRRAIYGVAVFLVPLIALWSGRIASGGGPPPLPTFGLHAGPLLWLWTPAAALTAWLLLPFCAEMSEAGRRARWLPVVLWAGVALAAATVLSDTTPTGMLLPLMPLLFALAGGGLSRLLPTLAGEFPSPASRYALAVLAVLALVGLHVRLEPRIEQVTVSTSAANGHHSR
jgi:hypothetical protein